MSIEKKLDHKIKVISYIEKIKMLNSNRDLLEFFNNMKIFTNEMQDMNIKGIYYFKEYLEKPYEIIKRNSTINIENIKNDLKNILVDIYRDIIFEFNINVYFLGEDKYGFIENEFLNLNIKKLKSIDYIYNEIDQLKEKSYNILIVENESLLKHLAIDNKFYKVYNYEKLINSIKDVSKAIYLNDYNYYFLNYEYKNAKKQDFDTLIVGNSYPLVGIDKKMLSKKAFNLSMHTQDLYYSYKLAQSCIVENKSINNCIIGVGYYLTYHDVSMGLSEYSKNMVRNIYMPILGDAHNSVNIEESSNLNINDYVKDTIISSTFNLHGIHQNISYSIYNENDEYFNSLNKRLGMLGDTKLSELSEEKKDEVGKQRAESHNNLYKYSNTYIAFKKIFKQFIEFLILNNVKPIIVVFPTSKYYKKYTNKLYRENFYKIIDNLKANYDFKLVDFNDIDIFSEDDFIDIDHLSESGCIKVTNYLNDLKYEK